MKQVLFTTKAPKPAGPYSQGLKVGNRVYVAGMRPSHPVTGAIPEGIEAQTRQCLENIRGILAEGGADFSHVVKVSAFLTDLDNFAEFNKVYAEYFTEPHPVRTTIACGLRGFLVEIDVIAEL